MSLVEIFFGIITLVIIILAVFLVRALISIRRTITHIDEIVDASKEDIIALIKDSADCAFETHVILQNAHQKAEELNPLFKGIENLGEGVESLTERIKKETDSQEEDASSHRLHIISQVMEVALLGVALWRKLVQRRSI